MRYGLIAGLIGIAAALPVRLMAQARMPPMNGNGQLSQMNPGDNAVFDVTIGAGVDANTYPSVLVPEAATAAAAAAAAAGEPASFLAPQFQGNRVHSDLRASFRMHSSERGESERGPKVTWQFGGSSGFRKDPSLPSLELLGNNVSGSTTAKLGGRTSLAATGSLGYLPYYSLLPDASTAVDLTLTPIDSTVPPPATVDYGLAKRAAYTGGAYLSLTRDLTAHSSLVFGYANQLTSFVNPIDPSLGVQSVNGRFRTQVTRYATFHVGYGHRLGNYSSLTGVPQAQVDDIDIGVDLADGHSLPLGRRTTLTFNTGAAVARVNERRVIGATGMANLQFRLAQTARANLIYTRSVQMPTGLTHPIFANIVTASIGAVVFQRLDLQASAAITDGSELTGGGYRSANTTARASVPLGHGISAFAQYMVYRYEIGSNVTIIAGVPYQQRRQTIMCGAAVSLALIHGPQARGE